MSPAQTQAWDKWLAAEYSALYWQYNAAQLGRIVVALNIMAGLTGTAAVVLLLADHPLLTKLAALVASAVTLFASYSSVGPSYEKAKLRAEFFWKLAPRYEALWNQSQQGFYEDVILSRLEVLAEADSFEPAAPEGEYDERLRKRVYQILVQSKGLPA